jgi:hypothetical protein
MADEIAIALQFTVAKNSFYFDYNPGSQTFDLTGSGGGNPGLVSVGTSEEDISFGDVSGDGWILIVNLDAASTVTWGASDTTMKDIGTIGIGGFALFQFASAATLRMQSNGGGAVLCAIHRFEA